MGVFGVGLAVGLVVGLAFLVPAVFILVVAFVYVRQQRGETVDINAGLSAYTVILVGVGALLLALGVGELLTAIMAEIDSEYTYGPGALGSGIGGGGFEAGDDVGSRQEQNLATGLALCIAGALAIGLHLWLRGWLGGEGRFDHGVEGAWDTFFAVILALIALFLVAQMLNDTLSRAITENNPAAGSTIAQAIAVLGLWAVYAWRALGHVGFLSRSAEGGPGGGTPI